jgi:penicillin-binding protein 1A
MSALAVGACGSSSALSDPPKGTDQTTVLLAADGSQLARLHGAQDRTAVTLDKVPRTLRDAVVATEDRRFYEHDGVDLVGMLRALVSDVTGGGMQGGSTITQQYVKNAYLTSEKTLDRKVDEARMAIELEHTLTKDQILERYLNTIYYGHGAYGVASATRVYFGKPVDKLTLAESAMIAGVIRSPGRFSPYLDAAAAKARRDLVLGLMLDQGKISQADHDAAVATPIALAGLKRAAGAAPWFVEWVRGQLVERFGSAEVLRGGLTVKTTLEPKMQASAEKAVAAVLDGKDDPAAAIVAVEPGTGAVRALVGGRDTSQHFDIATQGRRQPGSAFKPFVLATALSRGVSPRQRYDSSSAALRLPEGGSWQVSGPGDGLVSVTVATQKSVNPVFARLILATGAQPVVDMAHTLGITSDIEAVPAIALGGLRQGVSPLEMADAYATLAAGGRKAEPYALQTVTGPDGTILFEAKPAAKKAISPALAWLVTDILTGVIDRGTGTAADIGRPEAGKTGTTQNNGDAWFVGYVPQLAASVWVGYPDAARPMTDVHGTAVTGGTLPARIWKRFMEGALAGTPTRDFPRPTGVVAETYCLDSGLKATAACPRTGRGWFLADPGLAQCAFHKVKLVVVPDVTGLPKAEAIADLTGVGLKVALVDKPSDSAPAGAVTSQDPRAGTEAARGATVTIVMAKARSSGGGRVSATISVAPSRPTPGGEARFSAGGLTGSKYTWDFGDGTSAEGGSVRHTYDAAGDYTVVVTTVDSGGTSSTATRAVHVK